MLTYARQNPSHATPPKSHCQPRTLARMDALGYSRLVQKQHFHVQHGGDLIKAGLGEIQLGRTLRVKIERVVQGRGADLRALYFYVRGCLKRPSTYAGRTTKRTRAI